MIEGLIVGVLYIFLYAILLCILVYAIIFICAKFEWPIPAQIQKLMWAAVLVVILIMIISLLMGWNPRFRVEGVSSGAVAAVPIGSAVHL